jgi:hypothetical protein
VSTPSRLLLQIGVELQRGYVPVDEKMRVLDKKGEVVSFEASTWGIMCEHVDDNLNPCCWYRGVCRYGVRSSTAFRAHCIS